MMTSNYNSEQYRSWRNLWLLWIGISLLLYGFSAIGVNDHGTAAPNGLLTLEPFVLEVSPQDGKHIEFSWQIQPNNYLYKNQIKLFGSDNSNLLSSDTLPAGNKRHDEILGDYEVYSNQLKFVIPLHNPVTNQMLLHYQGCSDDGFCFLPITQLITLGADGAISITEANLESFPIEESPHISAGSDNNSDRFTQTLRNKSLPLALLIFFGLGLLLSFTPCVLPMIPLVVNLIVGSKSISPHRSFILSGSYVMGMTLSYTIAGICAGLLGATLSGWLQQPLVLSVISTFLILLAFNQFGIIKIKLPHFNTRLHQWGQRQIQGSILGAFILGIISALIISPCVTAPLIGVLTYIGQDGDPITGGLTLFSLSLGMGLPLILVAMLSNIILPKVGHWMQVTKDLLGVALIGLAIWLLGRILPSEIILLLWGGLCIISAVFFKAFEKLQHPRKAARFVQAIGILLAIYGVILIINAVQQRLRPEIATAYNQLDWQQVHNIKELQQLLTNAKQQHSPVIIDFTAAWCTNCTTIEHTVFIDPQVQRKLQKFTLIKVDLTNMTIALQNLLESFNIFGPPTMIFLLADGTELPDSRLSGNFDSQELLQVLTQLLQVDKQYSNSR